MKQGKSLTDLAIEIERQAKAKQDFVAPTNALTMTLSGDKKNVGLDLAEAGEFDIAKTAHRQLGQHLGIHAKYYDKMRDEAPDLLAHNVNHWFQKTPSPRMIRTLDGRARAFLSDSYRPLDNFDLAEAVLPIIQDVGAEVHSCEITETRMYLKAVVPGAQAEIPPAGVENFEWGKEHHAIDVVQAGIVISNSEVGYGSLAVQPAIHTVKCSNLAIFKSDAMRKYHIGAKLGGSGSEDVVRYLSQQAQRVTNEAIFLQVRDLTKAAMGGEVFDKLVNGLREARGEKIEGDPAKVVDVTAKQLDLSDTERGGVLKYLASGGDLTRYGLSNAVTRFSQDVEDYDRATELEQAGAAIITLPQGQWKKLAEAA